MQLVGSESSDRVTDYIYNCYTLFLQNLTIFLDLIAFHPISVFLFVNFWGFYLSVLALVLRSPMDRRGASNVLNWSSEIGERRLARNSAKLCNHKDSYTGGKPCPEVFYPAEQF